MRDDVCIFILTHGRPDRVYTYNSLLRAGYSGKMFVVIDDEDPTEDQYREQFGEQVLQFCKADLAKETDEGDNFQHRKAIVYARNACWQLAEQVGCRFFLQFDDDYTGFEYRFEFSGNETGHRLIRATFDEAIEALVEFHESTSIKSLAMAQGGDWIGGHAGKKGKMFSRKCMNSWVCDTQKPFKFFGHMNEDVSAYVTYGHRGDLFLTVLHFMLKQVPTQVAAGGMSDLYLRSGTYVKSFYSILAAPSCVKIGLLHDPRGNSPRLHHAIDWVKAVPRILHERHRKPDEN